MVQHQYPYLDLSVRKETRKLLFSDRAAFICSQDFKVILWANVAGAKLFGYDSIEELIAQNFDQRNKIISQCRTAVKSIKAKRAFKFKLELPKNHNLATLNLAIKPLEIDNTTKLYLVFEDKKKDEADEAAILSQLVTYLSNEGATAAILGFQGKVITATKYFNALGIKKAELSKLTYKVIKEDDRLVKRLLPTKKGEMAAGIGAIEEKPYRFLLIVAALSEKQNRKSITKKGVIATPKKAPAPVKTTSTSGKTKNTQKVTAKRKVLSKVTPLNNSVAEPDMAPTTKAAKPLSKPAKKTTAVKKALKKAKTQSKGAVSAQKSKNIKPSKTNTQTKPKVKVKTEMSPIVFAKEDKGIEQEAPLKKISEGKAIKFSWKTDADGKFVMVSNEILDTLGVDATLVLNKSWDEVARNFNLDQSEKIVELFNTKDTWSGQQVLWPISGSTDKDGMADNKLVPVDFAALPSVDRNKNFNGYNGFGIIHMNLIKTVTEPAPIKVEPAPKKSNAKPVEALNGEEKAAFDEIARTLGQSSDDEKIDTPEIAKPPLAKSTPAKPKPEPISNEATAIVPTPPIKKAQPLIEVTPPIETKPAIVPTPEKPEVAAKKTSHQDISGVLDQIPVPLMVYRDNSLLFASSDFLKLTHYKNIEEINEAGALDALFDNSADEGDKSDADQMQLILKNGETCNVNARLQRIDWSDGNALLMAFTSIEQQTQNMAITEPQANTEEKISTEHDKAIGMTLEDESQFMTRVSHEIRAPLNTIIGFSDLIMDERFGPLRNDKYREYMRDIRRSGSLMLDIINDYLDLSKIKSGDIILKEEMININQLIKDTVAIVQPQANGDQIIIRTSLSKAVPSVKTDSNTVRQVVLNLISSAIKATPTGGQIIISSLLDSSGEVIVRIKDSGDGIDEEMLEYVLEPSKSLVKSKVDPSQMDKHHSGLELSLTKAMVEATGAKFEIFSELKKGTVVELAFPKT